MEATEPNTNTTLQVAQGTHVEVELVDEAGAREPLAFDIVPDAQADFAQGFLGAGTPLAQATPEEGPRVDSFEFIRTIAVARILMPKAQVRLSAGRQEMSDETQAFAFLAGANSIFYGEKLLTTGNPDVERDRDLLARLKIEPETQAQTDARSGCC